MNLACARTRWPLDLSPVMRERQYYEKRYRAVAVLPVGSASDAGQLRDLKLPEISL
jgi:hypothetical protein